MGAMKLPFTSVPRVIAGILVALAMLAGLSYVSSCGPKRQRAAVLDRADSLAASRPAHQLEADRLRARAAAAEAHAAKLADSIARRERSHRADVRGLEQRIRDGRPRAIGDSVQAFGVRVPSSPAVLELAAAAQRTIDSTARVLEQSDSISADRARLVEVLKHENAGLWKLDSIHTRRDALLEDLNRDLTEQLRAADPPCRILPGVKCPTRTQTVVLTVVTTEVLPRLVRLVDGGRR